MDKEGTIKRGLTLTETVTITSMLFGMFFGAGNLIFPVYMGQLAGGNVWGAIAGFLITGVGMPLLGVAALGISRSNGLFDLCSRISPKYSVFFTCALYLTIGPFFAIPRCATVSFTVGIEPLLTEGTSAAMWLGLFSLVFFAFVLGFSLKPGKILTWIGKLLNPLFLICLGIFIVAGIISPMGSISDIQPEAAYQSGAFFNGFLEGYNTMDLLASLAFGIIVVNVIKDLGVEQPGDVAVSTVKAGIFSCLLMGVIYVCITVMGVQSRGITAACSNGGEALYVIANHYFGRIGTVILAVTVTFACLKTAVGLITSCSETFSTMFAKGPGYKTWAIIFTGIAFLLANLGLNSIIAFSIPVLMLLYPLAITLIFLSLFGSFFGNDRKVYVSVTAFTMIAAICDFLKALPAGLGEALHVDVILGAADKYLPFFDLGMGWIVPAAIGLVVGLVLHVAKKQA